MFRRDFFRAALAAVAGLLGWRTAKAATPEPTLNGLGRNGRHLIFSDGGRLKLPSFLEAEWEIRAGTSPSSQCINVRLVYQHLAGKPKAGLWVRLGTSRSDCEKVLRFAECAERNLRNLRP